MRWLTIPGGKLVVLDGTVQCTRCPAGGRTSWMDTVPGYSCLDCGRVLAVYSTRADDWHAPLPPPVDVARVLSEMEEAAARPLPEPDTAGLRTDGGVACEVLTARLLVPLERRSEVAHAALEAIGAADLKRTNAAWLVHLAQAALRASRAILEASARRLSAG